MVKYDVPINILSKNNFLVTNIFPLGMPYAVCTTYADIPDSSQCKVEITFKETVLSPVFLEKFSVNIYETFVLFHRLQQAQLTNLQNNMYVDVNLYQRIENPTIKQ